MKINTLFRKGVGVLTGAFILSAFGCFTSFAYDNITFNTCTVENRNSIVVKGTAEKKELQEGELKDDG